MVEIVDIGDVGSELWRKEFCIHRRLFGAGIAVQPGEVCERKGLRSQSLGGRQRLGLTLRLRRRSEGRTGRRGERLRFLPPGAIYSAEDAKPEGQLPSRRDLPDNL